MKDKHASEATKKLVEKSCETAVESQIENKTEIPYFWLLAKEVT